MIALPWGEPGYPIGKPITFEVSEDWAVGGVSGVDHFMTRLETVEFGGTVSEPDTSDFYDMLDEAAQQSKGVVGAAMRRTNKKLQSSR